MVRFTVLHLGEHTIENLMITGPNKDILMEICELFLTTYHGPSDADLDYLLAKHIIDMSYGQGTIKEWTPSEPGPIQ